jgi:hypothetical protein
MLNGEGIRMTTQSTDLEQLGDEIAELAAHLHAATFRLLARLHEFDRREGWGGGFRSCAHWLSWRTGSDLGAAREKVRVARALEALPLLSDAMRRGELSYAKVRALTRIATPENEAQLLELARHGTAAHIEKVVRAWRRVDRLEEALQERDRHAARHFTMYVDEDGSHIVRGRLDPEVGAVLERALEAATGKLYDARDATTPAQRKADAVGLIAECALEAGLEGTNRAGRFQVVVHVDAEALREDSANGQAVLADGVRVSAETSRRLSCDASRIVMVTGENGEILDVGRRSRTVPSAIRRALEHRDRGCRFPGCGLKICDVHHIVHWADGGASRLSNTALLCRVHHRAVHEEGFRMMMTAAGEVLFEWPDGRPLVDAPAAPRLPEDPVSGLFDAHRDGGLEIDAWTATADWRGERLDLDFAVRTLRCG